VCQKSLVTLSDASTIGRGAIETIKWEVEKIGSFYGDFSSFTFKDTGNYKVVLYVESTNACKDSISRYLISYPLPNPSFLISSAPHAAGYPVAFENSSKGAVFYQWNFGDGGKSSLEFPEYSFAKAGNYAVVLEGISPFGCKQSYSKEIRVVPAIVDVAIKELEISHHNNYTAVSAKMVNFGTVPVKAVDLEIETETGPLVKERWIGKLESGHTINYDFISQVYASHLSQVYCITASIVSEEDEHIFNNTLCENNNMQEVFIFDPAPNPANNHLLLKYILSKPTDVLIDILNHSGQEVNSKISSKGNKGINSLNLDISNLSVGLYLCRIYLNGEVYYKRFIKI
jgi:PKD repeat protein